MSVQPLNDLWTAAAGQPYEPTISKNSQFTVGFTLLFTGMRHASPQQIQNNVDLSIALVLSGYFGLNPSLKNLPLIGIPASLAAGYVVVKALGLLHIDICERFGAVYMICAVGVYV
ncbi:hypothetical protein MBLNU459_g4609t2 [Dothideomycetes sp. NU459]